MTSVIEKKVCPVCGSEQKDIAINDCYTCKFQFPFVTFWASPKSFSLWNNKVQEYKTRYQKSEDMADKNKLILGRDSVGILASAEHTLKIIFGDGRRISTYDNIEKYVSNNNNSAFVFRDGTVKVEDDNTYGQCNVQGYSDIKDIELSPTCVFLVRNDGSITAVGAIDEKIKSDISSWNDISMVSASEQLCVVVTNSNTIKVSASKMVQINKDKMLGWSNILKVCVHNDKCVALTRDGKVNVSWDDEFIDDINNLKDIDDILYDGTYIIALDSSGKVHLVGKAKNKFLDAGRVDASTWKDIVAISCSNYAICGYDSEGNLHFAGKVGGKNNELLDEWDREIKKSL